MFLSFKDAKRAQASKTRGHKRCRSQSKPNTDRVHLQSSFAKHNNTNWESDKYGVLHPQAAKYLRISSSSCKGGSHWLPREQASTNHQSGTRCCAVVVAFKRCHQKGVLPKSSRKRIFVIASWMMIGCNFEVNNPLFTTCYLDEDLCCQIETRLPMHCR